LDKKGDSHLFKVGMIGAVVAALCCFTPILVVILGILGLSAFIGYLDIILLPALCIFVGIIFYAMIKKRREECNCKLKR